MRITFYLFLLLTAGIHLGISIVSPRETDSTGGEEVNASVRMNDFYCDSTINFINIPQGWDDDVQGLFYRQISLTDGCDDDGVCNNNQSCAAVYERAFDGRGRRIL